jgi:putative flippase GtrA
MSKLSTLLIERRQDLIRFLKFCFVGVIGTFIDFGTFNLMHHVLGVHQVPSNTLSVSAAIVNNYLWSRYWVYAETKNHQGGKKFVRFVVVSTIAWALNTSILWSTDHWILGERGLLAGLVSRLAAAVGMEHHVFSSNAAKVIATNIVLFWNFFANRFWTFRDVDQREPITELAQDSAVSDGVPRADKLHPADEVPSR